MPTTLPMILTSTLLLLATASAELCDNTCSYHGHSHSNNGICEDGGIGARLSICASGTDCTDCGPRIEPLSRPSHEAHASATSVGAAGDAWAGLRASEALYEGEWLFVWVAGLLALTAMEWARYLYRFSRAFRVVQHESGFIAMARDDSGASEAEKVAVMKTLYHEWPGAVSALIADQTSPHGIVFRALLLTAGILSLRADLGALSPGAAGANGPALFHALRVVALGAGTIGIA